MKYLATFIRIVRSIHTRPTKYFFMVVLGIVGLFFLAYMHNYNIVYLIMFFVFALAGASSIIGRLNLYELEASVLTAQNFFANTASSYTLSLYNPTPRERYALECSNAESSLTVDLLKAQQSRRLILSCTPSRRGPFYLPSLQIGSYFPLPHELLYRRLDLACETLVYPEPKGEPLESFTAKNRSFFGEHDDFEGIRSYNEGESLALIHWPSYAKSGELMAKEFVLLEESETLHFYFQACGKDDEQRLSQLCLWALECRAKGIGYSIHFPSQVLSSRQRSHHEILSFLARYAL